MWCEKRQKGAKTKPLNYITFQELWADQPFNTGMCGSKDPLNNNTRTSLSLKTRDETTIVLRLKIREQVCQFFKAKGLDAAHPKELAQLHSVKEKSDSWVMSINLQSSPSP